MSKQAKIKMIDIAEKLNSTNMLECYFSKIRISKTYTQLKEDVLRTLRFLRKLNIQKNDRIGIKSGNRYEWILLDFACFLGGIVLYAFHMQGFDDNRKLIDTFGLKYLFTEAETDSGIYLNITALMEEIASETPDADDISMFGDDDIFTVVFTSGTTGEPKGLGLKVKSIGNTINATAGRFGFSDDDKVIVFLPLSVFTSRLYIYGAILLNLKLLLATSTNFYNALQLYQPTILQAVPFFFESIYKSFCQKALANSRSKLIYAIFISLLKAIPAQLRKKIQRKVFKEIYSFLGSRMRVMITGTAPIPVEVLRFFRNIGIRLFESYGLNETGVIALNSPENTRIGSVGKLMDGYEIVLDENSQLLVKSDYCWSTGYINISPEISEKIFNKNGLIYTGDIGYIDRDGFLYLKGRISDIILLSTGEKIHPDIIEKILNNSPLIKQSFVCGKNRPFLVCVLVKNDEKTTTAELENELEQINRKLSDYQQIRNFVIAKEAFSLKNKLLSNNMKLNREAILNEYGQELSRLYS